MGQCRRSAEGGVRGGVGGGVADSFFEACYFFLAGRQTKTYPSGFHWRRPSRGRRILVNVGRTPSIRDNRRANRIRQASVHRMNGIGTWNCVLVEELRFLLTSMPLRFQCHLQCQHEKHR